MAVTRLKNALKAKVNKYAGAFLTIAVLAVGLPATIQTSVNAAQIGGNNADNMPKTAVASGTATITIKYLRKDGNFTDWKAWVWCQAGTGNWGTDVKQGVNNASGTCTSGAWINLGSALQDSWGSQATFTVTGVSNLSVMGIIVYSRAGDGDITGTRDGQSAGNRYFNMQGATTTAWVSDDGANIYDSDPKTPTAATGAIKIHYNRPDNNFSNWYARLAFQAGTNLKTSYRSSRYECSSNNSQNMQAYGFDGTSSSAGVSSIATFSAGTDTYGKYITITPTSTFYTGGYTYYEITLVNASSGANALGDTTKCASVANIALPNATSFDPATYTVKYAATATNVSDIYVKHDDAGSAYNTGNPYTAPTVTSVSPTAVPTATTSPATSVTITGTNLYPVASQTPVVTIDGTYTDATTPISGGTVATVTSVANDGTSIVFNSPALSSGNHKVYVQTAGGVTSGTTITAIAGPTVTNISPSSALRGATITLTGTALDTATSVTVGGVAATITPSPSATSLSFTVPQGAGSGSVPVVVSAPGGTASTTLTVLDAPTLSGVLPVSALRGTSVTLSGTFLTSASSVTVGGVAATIDSNTATAITFKIPNGATSGLQAIQVTTAGGTASTNFTVLDVPVISSLSADSAVRGAPLTINGTGLQNATSVTVGGVSATITSNTATAIGVTVPASATPGPADIVVTSAGGTSNTASFTVKADAPVITSVSPTSAPQGSKITITGTSLGGSTVTIEGKNATIDAGASDTSLTVTIPSNATVGTDGIVLTTLNGSDSSRTVTVTAGIPTVTSVSPTAAARNANITITGTYLTDTSSVIIGGVALTQCTVVSATTITGKVPATAPLGVQNVVVTTPGGSATGSVAVLDTPAVTSLSATSGKRGDSITINGTSFGEVSAVTIGGVAMTGYTVNSLTSITATVPNSALSGAQSIVVTTSVGTSNSDKTFTVYDAPVITSISPTSGLLGATVTLTGTNLVVNANTPTVTVGGIAAIVASSPSPNATSVVITIPNGLTKNATAAVVLTNDGGTSNSDKTFTPVDAPTLTSVTPTSGGRGITVALVGTNLSNASTVTINGASATIASSPAPNATSLTATVPNGATSGAGIITVTTPGGISNTVAFTVLDLPTISSLSATSGARGDQIIVSGTYLSGASFTIAGVAVTPLASPSPNATSATLVVPTTAAFGASTIVATTNNGSVSTPFTVTGYNGTASLKIHYYRSDFSFNNTYIHAWLPQGVGSGTVSGKSVGVAAPSGSPQPQTPETSVTNDGTDSYGGVATVTVTGASNVQQICFLVWVNTAGTNTFTKDNGSAEDRCRSLISGTDEIWLRANTATVSDTDPFAGRSPSPNASATQTVTIHYDGDTSKYPNVYVGTRSDLNTQPTATPYSYWVDARFYDFTNPTTVVGTTGTFTSKVGSDYFGKYVTFTLPYYAAHTTRINMIVTSGADWDASPAPTKDGGSQVVNSVGNRYLTLDPSGNTQVFLKSGDTTGDAAFAANPYASPSIASISATTGKAGDLVTLTGTNLVVNANNPTVTVGGITALVASSPSPNATSVSFNIPDGLTANVASAIQLTNAGGISNSNLMFTVIGPPTITSASPSTGIRGSTVTVTGTGLSDSTVTVGGVSATVGTNTATSLTFTIPQGANTGSQIVSVTTPGGTSTLNFTVIDVPAITSLSANSAIRGTSLTINGTGLQNATSVTVGGVSATVTSNTSTAIGITVPMAATIGSAPIVVTSAGGASNSQAFTVLPDLPTASGVNPSAGPRSATITITGTNFTGLTGVTVGGTSAQITVSPSPTPNDTSVTVTVPGGLVSGPADVVVTTASGSVTLKNGFTVVDAPIITAPSPSYGPRGTTVTISGSYLTGATAVTFGGVAAKSYTVANATTINAVVPDGVASGLADIVVTTAGGVATAAGAFNVIDAPVISSLSQSSGPRGISLTINGSFLANATSVKIGTVAATVSDNSASSVTATVPEAAITGTQNVSVTTGGGTATLTAGFTVVDAPTFSGISPSFGGRESYVVISGTNFTGATAVKFGGVSSTNFTVNSATRITAQIPDGASTGNVNVAVTTAGGTVTATNAYIVVDSPVITNLNVNKAHRDDQVVITGTALDSATVTIDGKAAVIAATPAPTSTSLTVTVPQAVGSGSVGIIVTTVAGDSNSFPLTVVDTPVISGLSSSMGKRGDVITVTGQFLAGATFTIGGAVATPASSPASSDTSATLTVPSEASYGDGSVVAETEGGIASSAYSVLMPPSISSLSTTQGHAGDSMTVNGANFANLTSVTLNGAQAVVLASPSAAPDDNAITIEVPATTSGVIVVTTLGGSATSDSFQVLISAPTVTSISPSTLRRGDQVTVAGANLYGTSVQFAGKTISATAAKDGLSTTFSVPSDAALGTNAVVVSTADSQSTSPVNVTILADVPSVTSVTPLQVHHGDVVTVTGNNLAGTSATLGGTEITPTIAQNGKSFAFMVDVNAALGDAALVVVTVDGQKTAPVTLPVLADVPALTSVSSTSVHRGDIITVSGMNLSNVTYTIDGWQVAMSSPSPDATSATFVVPDAANDGQVDLVAITSDDQASNTLTLTILQSLPSPSPTNTSSPSPVLTSVTPGSAKRGAYVTLSGANLASTVNVTVDGKTASFSNATAGSVKVQIPAAASLGSVSIVVTTSGGTSSINVTVLASPPTITKFVQSKSLKRGVGTVTVYGTNLLGATVKVGTLTAVVKPGATNLKLTFVIPAKAAATKVGQFTITTKGGSVKSVKTLKITIK